MKQEGIPKLADIARISNQVIWKGCAYSERAIMTKVECGMRNAECGMRSVEWGVRSNYSAVSIFPSLIRLYFGSITIEK